MHMSLKRCFLLSFVLACLLVGIFASGALAASTSATYSANPQATSSCSSSFGTVTLYKGLDQQGDSICFGVGKVNLADFPGWDDQVRSWSTPGCPPSFGQVLFINFFTDSNSGGQVQKIIAFSARKDNFTGADGTLPPQTLSSITVSACLRIG